MMKPKTNVNSFQNQDKFIKRKQRVPIVAGDMSDFINVNHHQRIIEMNEEEEDELEVIANKQQRAL